MHYKHSSDDVVIVSGINYISLFLFIYLDWPPYGGTLLPQPV